MRKNFTLLLATTFFAGISSMGQIFFNNGAQIWTGPQSVIRINGGIENNSSLSNGNIDHNGTMTVTVNSTFPNPGDVILNNNSTWQGDGIINLEGDWVNNAVFQQDLSLVHMYASNNPQQISGTNVTTFHKLRLTGTGTGANRIKTQTLNARVDSLLELTDRELATQTFTMFVLNPDPNAVTNLTASVGSEGFVSSLAPGTLSRLTNTTQNYLYPVGSSLVLTRYRPVQIRPQNTSANEYTVRFVNHDSDNDGFLRTQNDGVQCATVDTFYHAILRPVGTTPADITIAYLPSADGTWNGMAHWRTTNNMWNDMASSTLVTPGTLGNYTILTRSNWLFANPGAPYLLSELKPAAPQINCPGPLCANSPGNVFTVNGNGISYTWTVNNGVITNGQGNDTILVSWGGTSGYVYVVANSQSGCPSLPDSCFVTVSPAPIAAFTDTAGPQANPIYTFIDNSTGATTWFWNFGDGNTSNLQNPNHQFPGPGTYTVTLIVTNAAGCTDTITTQITVTEFIIIPNVFTPNGDGLNDEWYIPNSGMESFHVQIFNRWGTLVFESKSSEIRWDGRSTSGNELSDGTYYYILVAVMKGTNGPVKVEKDMTGFISLLRGKKD
jgi:gliding motility-associated-like protein